MSVGVISVIAYVVYLGAAGLMVFAILLQEGKGGGLSALGGTQAESAFGATNPIRRMTVVLAILFFLLAGFLSYMGRPDSVMSGAGPPAAEAEEEEKEAEGEPEAAPVAEPVAEPEAAPAGEAPAEAEDDRTEEPEAAE